ncbi:methyltransferase domain-containing protein [Streptomyces syringium]|uniref:methyltransferase domain-containing protein n=1 Tax=Streptomyces syringium TaxID=76729 RepID=UPI0034070F80
MTIPSAPIDTDRRDAFVGRLFDAGIGSLELVCVYLGDKLGLYRALADRGPLTTPGLADAAGVHERYAREWLEQQATAGILDVDDPARPSGERRYTLPPEHAEVLLDGDSLNYLGFLGWLVGGMMQPRTGLLMDAFRTGGGVPAAVYGSDIREMIAAGNRPQFLHLLADEWLPAVPEVHARLLADPPARIADIACGAGWSTIVMAKAYPKATVDGYDLDAAAIHDAHANARAEGVSDRVHFRARDAADPDIAGRYDLVTVFEAIHDMARPVDVLSTIRRITAEGGVALIADERVPDTFEAPADEIQRFFYGASLLYCLPTGMAEQPSAATGTVMRTPLFREYAQRAGYADIEVLPIEHMFWRLYLLRR